MKIVLSRDRAQHAEAVATGREEAAALHPAATVVLLRSAAGGGVEAYLQRRHNALAFAPGVFAFPGGRVDVSDAELPEQLWSGPSVQQWARWFAAADERDGRAHVVAVVRELFEETGVLLARPRQGSASWPGEDERAALSAGDVSLVDVLTRAGLVLDSLALTAWSRWVTPRFERKRFDTWFFVAVLPADQRPRVATQESHEGRWLRPDEATRSLAAGTLAMLPPTWWTLGELAEAPSARDAVAHPPPMRRYTVGWTRRDDEVVMVLPDDADYPGADPREGQ